MSTSGLASAILNFRLPVMSGRTGTSPIKLLDLENVRVAVGILVISHSIPEIGVIVYPTGRRVCDSKTGRRPNVMPIHEWVGSCPCSWLHVCHRMRPTNSGWSYTKVDWGDREWRTNVTNFVKTCCCQRRLVIAELCIVINLPSKWARAKLLQIR